jgi:signal transduction histidine kinase
LLEELDAHRHHLEKLVRERTVQLADKAEELETALAAEKALNKLQRDFVSMVSHEFRTPLAIIDGTAQRIGRRLPNASLEDAASWLGKIRNAVTRMTRLIESTLAASRMDAGEVEINPVDCDLSVILTGCCERQKELSPHHDIKLSIDPRPMMLRADPGALEQVFTNLLSNAVKYAPDRPEIQVRAWREENQLLIEVQDHGLGMDEVDLAKLFKRFFRAKTSTGIMGTGIGLNLIKMLIERHGGAITVTSELDQGSTFGVRLPVNGPQLAKPASRASADRPKDQPAPTKADAAALAD